MENETGAESAVPEKETGAPATNPPAGGESSGGASAAADERFYDKWGLNDAQKGFMTTHGFKDPEMLMKSVMDTFSFVGADKAQVLKIPKPDENGNFDLGEVYKALGRPEKPEDYKMADNDFSKFFAPKLHELGFNPKQVEGLAAAFDEFNGGALKADETKLLEKRETEVSSLKQLWGKDYDLKTKIAEQAVGKYSQELGLDKDVLNKLGDAIGVDKAVQFFNLLGEKLDDGVKSLTGYSSGQRESREVAASKLEMMQNDPEVAKKIVAGDASTIREIGRLSELAHAV